ncbi:RHS repeat protein, partial [bacterium]|nr:RHS repeat protein [bacterium]
QGIDPNMPIELAFGFRYETISGADNEIHAADRLRAECQGSNGAGTAHSINLVHSGKSSGGQTTTYNYDALGNLMAVTLPNGTQIEYLVDGRNRRIGGRRVPSERADLVARQGAAQVAHGPARLHQDRPVGVRVVQQEDALAQTRQQGVGRLAVEAAARGLEAVQHAQLVALGLQLAQQPGAGVAEGLVVQVHGVLRGQHDAETAGAGLLQQGQQGLLAGGLGRRGQEAEDLVHVEQRAQAGGARLAAHPGDDLLQQQRREEHALGVLQVRDREDGVARPPVRRPQQGVDVQGLSLQPGRERRRRDDRVQGHRQGEALLRREEDVHVEDAQLRHRRPLHRRDQLRQVQVAALAPGVLEDRREQDVLAAAQGVRVDAGQAEQGADGARDLLAAGFLVSLPAAVRRAQGGEDGHRGARVRARRVDAELGARAQAADALAVLVPGGQALAPGGGGGGGALRHGLALAPRVVGVDPGQEVLGAQLREREQEIGEVALGVDDDRGHAVERRFL